MSATVLSALIVMSIGANICPVAAARALEVGIWPRSTSGLRTFGACTTTSAGVGAPGNAVISAL